MVKVIWFIEVLISYLTIMQTSGSEVDAFGIKPTKLSLFSPPKIPFGIHPFGMDGF
jgi:hypothetical protein